MPNYLTDGNVWIAFWPLLITALLISLILSLFVKAERREFFVSSAAFSMLGIATGYVTGLSREPAVNAVLPAVLSLFGALGVFMIGKDKGSRTIVGFCTFAFAVTLMLGILWGARMRWDIEQFLLSEEYLTYLAKTEALKKSLGLSGTQK
jgi:hypothetical protein